MGGLDFDKILGDLMQKGEEAIVKSASTAGQKFIDENQQKLVNLAYSQAGSLLDKYAGDDPAAAKAKIAELTSTVTQSGAQTAKQSIKEIIDENKWYIVGGVVLTIALSGLIIGGAVSYGAKSGGVAANPRKRRKRRKK